MRMIVAWWSAYVALNRAARNCPALGTEVPYLISKVKTEGNQKKAPIVDFRLASQGLSTDPYHHTINSDLITCHMPYTVLH